jgi:single-stranded DNA-binding protein
MLNNMNRVDLEGYVVFTPEVVESNGKRAMNFLIENVRNHKTGETRFRYNCVVWGNQIDKVQDKLVEGAFVRIAGHLQDNTLELPDGRNFHYSKTCADYIEFDD